MTDKKQCLMRWPSLRLTCRVYRGRFRVSTGPLTVGSGATPQAAWKNALALLDAETVAMYRNAYNKSLEQFGRGIQSASEGVLP